MQRFAIWFRLTTYDLEIRLFGPRGRRPFMRLRFLFDRWLRL